MHVSWCQLRPISSSQLENWNNRRHLGWGIVLLCLAGVVGHEPTLLAARGRTNTACLPSPR